MKRLCFLWFLLWSAAGWAHEASALPTPYMGRVRPFEAAAAKMAAECAIQVEDPVELFFEVQLGGSWQERPIFLIGGERCSYRQLAALGKVPERLSRWVEGAEVEKRWSQQLARLQEEGLPPRQIAERMEASFPFAERLRSLGDSLSLLPGRRGGSWYSLKALALDLYDAKEGRPVAAGNFTAYDDGHFFKLQKAYREGASSELMVRLLKEAYSSLEGVPYQRVMGKAFTYPTSFSLSAERAMGRYPWFAAAALLYLFALLFFIAKRKTIFLVAAAAAFAAHTTLLLIRIYLLERPPVSNMAETLLFVPWVAVGAGWFLFSIEKNRTPLVAAAAGSALLLALLAVSGGAEMEVVQAVLDSRYWLTIHVLMVVGSYGLFIVSGLLAHLYLIRESHAIARTILQTLYAGTAMLISGTLLGGVWAAQSWGRFWDWDPKESWAFISICVYLLVIHSYRFGLVGRRGLAMGAVAGLVAISFTWYGVNYILGTGFHSYGFGNGGELFYWGYIAGELLFLAYFFRQQFLEEK